MGFCWVSIGETGCEGQAEVRGDLRKDDCWCVERRMGEDVGLAPVMDRHGDTARISQYRDHRYCEIDMDT